MLPDLKTEGKKDPLLPNNFSPIKKYHPRQADVSLFKMFLLNIKVAK